MNETVSEIRRFCHRLRPHILDQMGLIPAVHALASEASSTGKLVVKVDVIGANSKMDPVLELVVFRVTQEALHNAMKHSGATSAQISIRFARNHIGLKVTDNRYGFHVREVLDSLTGTEKMGILGMRERVNFIGGEFSINSKLGKATTVFVKVPYKSNISINQPSLSLNLV